MEYDLSPDERTVVAALPGWPSRSPWRPRRCPRRTIPTLSPPTSRSCHRRTPRCGGPRGELCLGADEIAAQWAQWRADRRRRLPGDRRRRRMPGRRAGRRGGRGLGRRRGAGTDATNRGRYSGRRSRYNGRRRWVRLSRHRRCPAGCSRRPRLRRHASAARPGPVLFRAGDARTLRADGPGGRSSPGRRHRLHPARRGTQAEVLPVGPGPSLPGLLEALDKDGRKAELTEDTGPLPLESGTLRPRCLPASMTGSLPMWLRPWKGRSGPARWGSPQLTPPSRLGP